MAIIIKWLILKIEYNKRGFKWDFFTFVGIILLIIFCSTGDKNPIEGVWDDG